MDGEPFAARCATPTELGAWVAWCRAHPGEFDAALIERLATRIARGPDAVIGAFRDGELCVAGVIVDTCTNADDSADLAVIGASSPPTDAVDALLARAEVATRQGARRALDLAITASTRAWEPVARARGYQPAFAVYELRRDAGAPAPTPGPLPAGFSWDDLRPDAEMAAYHQLVVRAFSEVPGAQVSSAEEMRGSLGSRPSRVLRYEGALVGFVSVAGRELRSLGVAPHVRGLGLGDHLVAEGLAELGPGHATLSVAARNDRALRLYERHGFAFTEETQVLRTAL